MPVTEAFLTTCRTAVAALPELVTFRAALSNLGSVSRTARTGAWTAAYDDNKTVGGSPASRLAKAIRESVQAAADAAGTLSPMDRESAYRTVVAFYLPVEPKPPTAAQEDAELQRLATEYRLS